MHNTEYYKLFSSGEIIFKQGEKGDCAYLIEEGVVDVLLLMPDGHEQLISTRGQGALIGEMVLIDDLVRTATIRARSECRLLEIKQDDFRNRLDQTDPIIRMAAKVILLRYRDTLSRINVMGESGVYPTAEDIERSTANSDDALRSVKMANEFKHALQNGELELYYQPINDLKDGQTVGFEALMRWNHPERGLISPNDFIPVAEESGLIIEASKWALREACEALGRIEQALGMTGLLYVSVNFSGKDLAAENFTQYVYEILSETDTDPSNIQLEITERMLIQQPEKTRETLEMCRSAGLKIAIDDFGTGYSSLSYLHHFPIDCIKIDRAFITNMQKNESSMRLVQSIIHLAKNLGMTVTAEGVEEPEEVAILGNLDCDYAQGYFFAKPMPEAQIIATLRNKSMEGSHDDMAAATA